MVLAAATNASCCILNSTAAGLILLFPSVARSLAAPPPGDNFPLVDDVARALARAVRVTGGAADLRSVANDVAAVLAPHSIEFAILIGSDLNVPGGLTGGYFRPRNRLGTRLLVVRAVNSRTGNDVQVDNRSGGVFDAVTGAPTNILHSCVVRDLLYCDVHDLARLPPSAVIGMSGRALRSHTAAAAAAAAPSSDSDEMTDAEAGIPEDDRKLCSHFSILQAIAEAKEFLGIEEDEKLTLQSWNDESEIPTAIFNELQACRKMGMFDDDYF